MFPKVWSVLALLAPLLLVPTGASATAPAPARAGSEVAYTRWDTSDQWSTGRARGVVVHGDRLSLTGGKRQRLLGRAYDTGTWRSPWVTSSFAFDQLVASWSATTTKRSFLKVEVRARTATGVRSSWDTLALWAAEDRKVRRTTYSGQSDDLGDVSVDTWRARGTGSFTRWQMRVLLARKAGTTAPVIVDQLGAMTSRTVAPTGVSAPGVGAGTLLDVPSYSQMIHRGHYPQWGNGGEAWCSPTATAMVLGYYGRLPTATGVPAGHVDPWVDHTARQVYDHGYRGTGNWAFNTAYAAPLAGDAFVTRLRDLTEAEEFVRAGIPLVASIAFAPRSLAGAPISASAGHLLVIVGFTAAGDVIVNDPAAPDDASVRRTYDRGQLERAWLGASGGTVYVVRDAAHPLPPSRGNW